MPLALHVPPGHAGRMWLRRRREIASHGRDQLDRKLRLLLAEQERLHAEADRCRDAWRAAAAQARIWTLRVAVLGGEEAIRAATPRQPADIELTWASTVGLRYPTGARIAVPATLPPALSANAAVAPARAAAADALVVAARVAAAEEAVRRIDREVAATRRRLRALDKRWLPGLQSATAALELALEQAEQEDGIRLRRATGGGG